MVNVAKMLAEALPNVKPTVQLRQGVVTALNLGSGTCSVNVSNDLDLTTISEVRYFEPYLPNTGDVVWLFRNGTDLMILNVLADFTGEGGRCGAVVHQQGRAVGATNTGAEFDIGDSGVSPGWTTDFDSHGFCGTSPNQSTDPFIVPAGCGGTYDITMRALVSDVPTSVSYINIRHNALGVQYTLQPTVWRTEWVRSTVAQMSLSSIPLLEGCIINPEMSYAMSPGIVRSVDCWLSIVRTGP